MKQLGIISIGVLLGVAVCIGGVSSTRPKSSGMSNSSTWTPGGKVTLDKYDRVASGMSYLDVRLIIGCPGEELSRNHFDGEPGVVESIDTVAYSWVNDDGTNMIAMFQNGRLIQKTQTGLW